MPTSLPSLAAPVFVWGSLDTTSFLHAVEAAYAEVVHWRKNSFPVPFGSPGRKFVVDHIVHIQTQRRSKLKVHVVQKVA